MKYVAVRNFKNGAGSFQVGAEYNSHVDLQELLRTGLIQVVAPSLEPQPEPTRTATEEETTELPKPKKKKKSFLG